MGREKLATDVVPLGNVYMTQNALDSLDTIDVLRALERHATGDFGDLSAEDRQANEQALKDGTRILSAYWCRNRHRFWIITEADRSSTTVLLPEDY